MTKLSYKKLDELAKNDPSFKLRLDIFSASNYPEFVEAIEQVIDFASINMNNHRREFHDLDEDALTSIIVGNLRDFGLQAEHDASSAGHCDISVRERRGYLWLAEAKIYGKKKNYYLLKGFEKLTETYASGLTNQDRCELLVYYKNTNLSAAIERWRKYLLTKRENIRLNQCPNDNQVSRSNHSHMTTGRPLYVRHKFIVVFHKSSDK